MKQARIAISTIVLAAAALTSLATVPHARADQQGDTSVYNVLSTDPRFGTTIKMVYVAGAANRMSTAGNLTVFAATDTGWDNSPFEGKLSSLSSTGAGSEFPDSMGILQVLRGFIVRGKVPTGATDVKLESAAGRPIELDAKTMQVKWVDPNGGLHSAHISGVPIVATNGTVYPVDAVVGE